MLTDVNLYIGRFWLSLTARFAAWQTARLITRSVMRECPELRPQYCGYTPDYLFFKVNKPLTDKDKLRLHAACRDFGVEFRDSNPKVFFAAYRSQ